MFALEAGKAPFDAIIAGDAQLGEAVIDSYVVASPGHSQWTCQVCKEDSETPTMNTAVVPSRAISSDEGLSVHDFCISCLTYRYDQAVWLCKGPPSRTWPRTRSKPCLRAVRMLEVPVGVPCCPACQTVRHKFQEDEVFQAFCNSEDEPLPKNSPAGN